MKTETLPSIIDQEFCKWLVDRCYWVPNTEWGMQQLKEQFLWFYLFNMN